MNSLDEAWNKLAVAQEYIQDSIMAEDDGEPANVLTNITAARKYIVKALDALRDSTSTVYNEVVSDEHKKLTQCELPEPCTGSLLNKE